VTYSRKTIGGVVHVWSIFDNAWMPEEQWDEMERERLLRAHRASVQRAREAAVVDRAARPLKERP
jgi:hypothetical protein